MSVERATPPREQRGKHIAEVDELLEATEATPGEWFVARGLDESTARVVKQRLQRRARKATIRAASGKWLEAGSTYDVYARLPEGGER